MAYQYRIDATGTGVATIGKAPSGTVNVTLESGEGTLGRIDHLGAFTPYTNGLMVAGTSLAADCGAGTTIAVDVTTAPCTIITRSV